MELYISDQSVKEGKAYVRYKLIELMYACLLISESGHPKISIREEDRLNNE